MDLFSGGIGARAALIFAELEGLSFDDRVSAINELRALLHKHSPFADQPVDFVRWVRSEEVQANDYNPNSVAPPEMKLLEHSISKDGYTQPIVAWVNGGACEVVDGFHRNRVGKESKIVRAKVRGYLPVTIVNGDRTDRSVLS